MGCLILVGMMTSKCLIFFDLYFFPYFSVTLRGGVYIDDCFWVGFNEEKSSFILVIIML